MELSKNRIEAIVSILIAFGFGCMVFATLAYELNDFVFANVAVIVGPISILIAILIGCTAK